MFALNELSLEPCDGVNHVRNLLQTAFALRKRLGRAGWTIFVNRQRLWDRRVLRSGANLRDVGRDWPESERKLLHSWLSKDGPFWDDDALHSKDTWYWLNGELVTESTVAEVAARVQAGSHAALLSFPFASWRTSPIHVQVGEQQEKNVDVDNAWDDSSVDECLSTEDNNIASWNALEGTVRTRYTSLMFTRGAFTPLSSVPFRKASALRIIELCKILDELRHESMKTGRTTRGQELYQQHFTGANARFSDSSDTEVNDFRSALTFPVPVEPGSERLIQTLCRWHGKERASTFRIHFTWPISAEQSLWIVYLGPKITRK